MSGVVWPQDYKWETSKGVLEVVSPRAAFVYELIITMLGQRADDL